MARHQALEHAVERMAGRCNTELKQEQLHFAQRDVLNSLNNHWSGLTVFVQFPQVPMDNNTAERRMRNPGMGRKNYYGSGSQWSAGLAAMMFSLFQTVAAVAAPIHTIGYYSYLTACADNGGRAPVDLSPFIPWQMSEQRKQQLAKPIPMTVAGSSIAEQPNPPLPP